MPLKDKTGTSITSALKFLFQNWKPINIQSYKGTEFVNATVQKYIKRQRVSFHMTQNLDIQGSVIERFEKSLKTTMFKYFTKNNTYRYMDILHKLLTGHDNSIHSTICMPPTKFNPSNIHSVWQRRNSLYANIPLGRVKFKLGYLLRITKEKVKFAKGMNEPFLQRYFGLTRLYSACPNLLMNWQTCKIVTIEGQFYNYEVVKVTFSPHTEFEIDKIVRTRNMNSMKQHFVKWRGYVKKFNSWVNSTDIKII